VDDEWTAADDVEVTFAANRPASRARDFVAALFAERWDIAATIMVPESRDAPYSEMRAAIRGIERPGLAAPGFPDATRPDVHYLRIVSGIESHQLLPRTEKRRGDRVEYETAITLVKRGDDWFIFRLGPQPSADELPPPDL